MTAREKTRAVELRAKKRIPGGTQLLSKRPELFAPEQWPAYYSSAKGVEIVDLDGTRYIDMTTSGIGSCVLGYADADVNGAVVEAIAAGSMSSLNCPEEVELAELLCDLHPWADMARFSRAGGEALAIAVRIARASTRRTKIAFCGYHGWHDWYLAANLGSADQLDGHLLPGLSPTGVAGALRGSMLPFRYQNLGELHAAVAAAGDDLAAIVMEPVRSEAPEAGFLEAVRESADRTGAVLIFDEVTSGFRLNCGGIHLRYGIKPDLAVFAKALGNGFPIAAIIGRGDVMNAAQESFISSTFWTERIGPVAALAMLKKYRANNVSAHLDAVGARVQRGWREIASAAGLEIHISGITPLSHISFGGASPQAAATLFTQEMLDRGILAGKSFYPSFAHRDEHVQSYLAAVRDVFGVLAEAERANDYGKRLRGPVAHDGFRRLT